MKKIITLFSLSAAFFLFFNGKTKPNEAWLSCYSKTNNKVFFNPLSSSSECGGDAYYRGPSQYQLIENSSSNTFAHPIAGTKRTVLLKNGRRLLATQWKKMGQANRVIVLEPRPLAGRVKKVCEIKNQGNAFATRYNQKIQTFQVQVLKKRGKLLKRVWKNCHL